MCLFLSGYCSWLLFYFVWDGGRIEGSFFWIEMVTVGVGYGFLFGVGVGKVQMTHLTYVPYHVSAT